MRDGDIVRQVVTDAAEARDAVEHGKRQSIGLSYEAGVHDALEWALGRTDDKPVDLAPEIKLEDFE